MTVKKLSISMDTEVAAAAREAAEAAGLSLSAWLSRAAVEAAAFEAGKQGVREFLAENGPFPDEVKEWGEDAMNRLGIGRR